jgi:hypothetical protein
MILSLFLEHFVLKKASIILKYIKTSARRPSLKSKSLHMEAVKNPNLQIATPGLVHTPTFGESILIRIK